MEGDEGFEAADAIPANKDGGGGIGGGKGGDLGIFKFYNGGMDADCGEEFFHDVAHAAGRSGEDDDGVFGYEALDSGFGGFVVVD